MKYLENHKHEQRLAFKTWNQEKPREMQQKYEEKKRRKLDRMTDSLMLIELIGRLIAVFHFHFANSTKLKQIRLKNGVCNQRYI